MGRTLIANINIKLPRTRQKRPPHRAAVAEAEREPPKSKIARTTDEHREQPADMDELRCLSVAAVSIMLHSLCDSPDDVLSLSLVSKDIHDSCKESMEDVCRRRWKDRFEFQRRWDSARADFKAANAGPGFWYYRYFEEERRAATANINGDDLKRLSWLLQHQPQYRRQYLINFNDKTPRFKKNWDHAVDVIDQGRTDGRLSFLLWGPSKNRAHMTSVNWFLQENGRNDDVVLCLGMPNKHCIPCLKFKVERLTNTWEYVLRSDKYVFTSVIKSE